MSEIYGSPNSDSDGDGYRPHSANDSYRPPSSYDGYGQSRDADRYPYPHSEVGKDPHYYDGDVKEALARDTTSLRQHAGRGDWDRDADTADGQDYGDDDDPWRQDPDIENYRLLGKYGDRFPIWAEMAAEHPEAGDDGGPGDDLLDQHPDAANYAAGLTPDIAWRNQGNPHSPNGWNSYLRENNDDTDQGGISEPGDMWGDTYPNTANAGLLDNDRAALDQAPTLTPRASDNVARGDHLNYSGTGGSDRPRGPDGPENTADQDAETADALRKRVTELEAAIAELRAENTQLARGTAELESENAQLGKTVAEVKAENADLRRGMSALETRMDRLEHNKTDGTAAPVHAKELGQQAVAEKETPQEVKRREWTSNEAIGFATVTGGSIMTGVAAYWSYLPATYAGITASVLGVGASAVALFRKHKEVRDAAHRPQH